MRINLRVSPTIATLLGLAIVASFLYLYRSDSEGVRTFRDRLEWVAYDLRMRATLDKSSAPDPRVVVVTIDEASLRQEGHWPWTRKRIAELIDKIFEAQPAVVGLDMVFAEAERNPVDRLLNAAGKGAVKAEVRQDLLGLREQLDGDQRLAESFAGKPVVMGYILTPAGNEPTGMLPPPFGEDKKETLDRIPLPYWASYTGNLEVLQSASLIAGSGGTFVVEPDGDGIIRRAGMVHRLKNGLYPSLSLEMARLYFGGVPIKLGIVELGDQLAIEKISLGGLVDLPTDRHGQVVIPYRGGAYSYTYLSAGDVLAGKADAKKLKDALVLVGATADGLYDLRATPTARIYPGVEVHANLLSGILDGTIPQSSAWAEGVDIIVLLGVGLLFTLIFPHTRPGWLAAISIASVLGYVWLSFWLWTEQRLVTSLALPVMMLLLLGIVNAIVGYLRETQGRAALKTAFGQYVPPELVEEMNETQANEFGFDGEAREMTVLFCDIRSFTTISESLSAAELKKLLNYFFTPMTKTLFDHRGTIDKYVGDMIMAFWGAPLYDPDHRRHAITGALAMLERVDAMQEEMRARGWPEVRVGIGLNTGTMNVGDMGSEFRRAYTVIGDAVNLGSRLEGLTKFYGVGLIVSESVREGQDTNFLFRQLDRVQVKGRAEPVNIFEPICRLELATQEQRAEAELHQKALNHYFERSWDDARDLFEHLQQEMPGLKVYGMYLERIAQLRNEDLGESWDGVYTHTSK